MRVYTYSYSRVPACCTLRTLYALQQKPNISGLIHAEYMTRMHLGSPIFSPARLQLQNLVMFAVWENNEAIEYFLENSSLGKLFRLGWHVRMKFLPRWGYVKEFEELPESIGEADSDAPVVAVTLARMKFLEIPRFIRWGKPVEELVRDHPGTLLASASIRLPNTVSTFSIWKTQREMEEMVHGHSQVKSPERHAKAMKERIRKNFHYEFTTLRFQPLEEHGTWEGRSNIIPFNSVDK